MKSLFVLMTVSAVFACASSVWADAMSQRWDFVRGSCGTPEGTEKLLAALRQSKAAGCTHILLGEDIGESTFERIPDQKPQYLENVKKLLAAAKDMNLVVAPYLCHMGYTGRYLRRDGNLAAGMPVKDMIFAVKGDMAIPDASAALDTSTLKEEGGRLVGRLKVKPFHHYRISFATSEEPTGDMDEYLRVRSQGGKRSHCRIFPAVAKDGESFFVLMTFNSLEAEEVTFDLAAKAGSVRDLKIEPAGFLLIIRRPLVPLTVASEDGKTVYEEGRDYKPIFDPVMNAKPFRGEITICHQPAVMELTANSRIKSGEKLRVSFWHTYRIRSDQVSISLEDPRVLEILENEFRNVTKTWATGHYCLDYEEIRLSGWEPMPGGEKLKPGEMLARHFRKNYDALKKYDPKAVVYTWSDMFCPGHNARPFAASGYYYLVNGNWDGSWEGLPKDVIVLNWYSPTDANVKFFAGRGHSQVLCCFADKVDTEGLKKRIQGWFDASAGSPDILGFMYVTYATDWSKMKEMFDLINTFDQWGVKKPVTPAGPVVKPPGETD